MKRQLPPNYKLPNLNSLITEGKKSQRADLPRPPLKPSTLCGYRDEACKRKKEQEKKIGQNFTPPKENTSLSPADVAQKDKGSWMGRLGRIFSNAFSRFSSVSAKGNSFLDADLSRSAGNLAPAAFNNTAVSAAPAMPPPTFNNIVEAKLDPHNRVGGAGVDLFSGNYNFTLSAVNLPGRNGMDLNIPLSLNSLVWIKYGSVMDFEPDYYPTLTAGFRTGFPEIEGPYVVYGANTYIISLPSGRRIEMREVASNQFEAIDSSYLYLTVNGDQTITLYSTDGTQYKFEYPNIYSVRRCTQIKDSDGNYISISYKIIPPLQTVIDKVTDTLGREIFFNYDSNFHLQSITQNWNGQTFYWAQFDYGTKLVTPNFGSLYVAGPNNEYIPVITRVILGNGARYTFDYNSWGQVSVITSFGEADNPRTQMVYAFPGTGSEQSDCPRFTQRNDGVYGWPGQIYDPNTGFGWAINYFYFDPSETFGQMAGPDAVTHREIFSVSGGTRGLTTRTETYYGGAIQQFTDITWVSDSGASPPLRPRVTETKICDDRNHTGGACEIGTDKLKKTTIEYTTVGGTIKLPWKVREYDEGGGSVYRSTKTDYVTDANYLSRRIIGLPSFTYLYEGDQATLKAQTGFVYDSAEAGFLQGHTSSVRQHDGAYGTGFQYRGNLTRARRYSVENGVAGSFIEPQTGYYITGNPAWTKDGANHETTITYDDSFLHYTEPSPGVLNVTTVSPNPPTPATYAYPTKITVDETPADVVSTVSYNYDFGAVTRTVDAKEYALHGSNPTTMRVNTYDSKRRPDKALIWKDGSKYSQTRFVYSTDHNWTQTWTTVNNLSEETWVLSLLDGVSRERITISEHPGSQGGLKSSYRVFDVMGRISEWSNVIEVNGNWAPYGDDAAGYPYSRQAFDWKGRPTVLTNQDGTTRSISYEGCGCAGEQVVTLIDEMSRKRDLTYDIFGRLWRERTYWDFPQEGSIYTTTTNAYNVRDQNTSITVDSLGESQNTVMTYDGHGRLSTRQLPIYLGNPQSATPYMSYEYYEDDTVKRVTDPRGAGVTYSYNNRRLVTNLSYTVPSGVASTPNVSFGYDEVGNRLWMDDGPGRIDYEYNPQGTLNRETRRFDELPAYQYELSYEYNLQNLSRSVTTRRNGVVDTTLNFDYDRAGRLATVYGSGYGGGNPFHFTSPSSPIKYRAWGATKQITYGNNRTMNISYNGRLQTTGVEMPGLMSVAYVYNNDGRIAQIDDDWQQPDPYYPWLSRRIKARYNYDSVGRVNNADDFYAPFHQHFMNYNGFGNLTYTSKGMGPAAPIADYLTTFVNNRDQSSDMEYDQAGHMTRIKSAQYSFDAVGRPTSQSDINLSLWYDGDGLQIKHAQSNSQASFTRYFLRSSVMGGKVLAELNQNGDKIYNYIYANGAVIAEYNPTGQPLPDHTFGPKGVQLGERGNEPVLWTHADQSNRIRWTTRSDGAHTSHWYLDEVGNLYRTGPGDAAETDYFTAIYLRQFQSALEFYIALYGDGSNLSGGCSINGVNGSCSQAYWMLNSGTLFSGQGTLTPPTFPRSIPSISWRALGDLLLSALPSSGIVNVDPITPPFGGGFGSGFLPAQQATPCKPSWDQLKGQNGNDGIYAQALSKAGITVKWNEAERKFKIRAAQGRSFADIENALLADGWQTFYDPHWSHIGYDDYRKEYIGDFGMGPESVWVHFNMRPDSINNTYIDMSGREVAYSDRDKSRPPTGYSIHREEAKPGGIEHTAYTGLSLLTKLVTLGMGGVETGEMNNPKPCGNPWPGPPSQDYKLPPRWGRGPGGVLNR